MRPETILLPDELCPSNLPFNGQTVVPIQFLLSSFDLFWSTEADRCAMADPRSTSIWTDEERQKLRPRDSNEAT